MPRHVKIEGRSIVKSFSYPMSKEDMMKQVEEVAKRENRYVSELIVELLEKYLQVHGNGNPVYPMDEWIENPTFMAFPAFLSENKVWENFLICKCSPQEKQQALDHFNRLKKTFDMAKNITMNKK